MAERTMPASRSATSDSWEEGELTEELQGRECLIRARYHLSSRSITTEVFLTDFVPSITLTEKDALSEDCRKKAADKILSDTRAALTRWVQSMSTPLAKGRPVAPDTSAEGAGKAVPAPQQTSQQANGANPGSGQGGHGDAVQRSPQAKPAGGGGSTRPPVQGERPAGGGGAGRRG
jgi:hypothetical protein